MHATTHPRFAHFAALCLALGSLAACATAGSDRPQEPDFQPSYRYSTKDPAQSKTEVTVGLIEPIFTGDGVAFEKENRAAQPFRDWVRAFTSSFNELFVAKGLLVVGPYKDLDGLTFPEKRQMSFALYPQIDFTVGYKVDNVHPEPAGIFGGVVTKCTGTFAPVGEVQLVAQEPLSGQKLWIKRVQIEEPSQSFALQGDNICAGKAIDKATYNAWLRVYEGTYDQVMQALDRYVTADEFTELKKEADLLKDKKTY